MKSLTIAVAGMMIAGLAGAAGAASTVTTTNSNGCKTVHLKPGENPPSGMSTSINAGNGQVTGHTTVGGGTGVSVSSGSGSSVTSGAGAAASSMSTSSNGKTTTVTSSDGTCTVYIRD